VPAGRVAALPPPRTQHMPIRHGEDQWRHETHKHLRSRSSSPRLLPATETETLRLDAAHDHAPQCVLPTDERKARMCPQARPLQQQQLPLLPLLPVLPLPVLLRAATAVSAAAASYFCCCCCCCCRRRRRPGRCCCSAASSCCCFALLLLLLLLLLMLMLMLMLMLLLLQAAASCRCCKLLLLQAASATTELRAKCVILGNQIKPQQG
jgi:hypothetical protein